MRFPIIGHEISSLGHENSSIIESAGRCHKSKQPPTRDSLSIPKYSLAVAWWLRMKADSTMTNSTKFYIDGEWSPPIKAELIDVIDPANETAVGRVSMGSALDVDRAVAAAAIAFRTFGQTSIGARVELIHRIIKCYRARLPEIAKTISMEMGAPISFARDVQAAVPLMHFEQAIKTLEAYQFERAIGSSVIVREPIGVCGLITAWNWPLMLVTSKLAYALAAGCTTVLKPSEIAPLSSILLAEVLHEAGVPRGVFNLVNGDGPVVGQAICSHRGVDMVSFTGSTHAGIMVAKAAADSVKRVHQELGGKSANIILPDADLGPSVSSGLLRAFSNAGQSCQAPTRMFVQSKHYDQSLEIAKKTAEALRVGDPSREDTTLGPVVSNVQFDRIQRMIESGVEEGARIVTGGLGLPEGCERGFYVRPTVFSEVRNDMTIAQDEIFGPVLPILAYEDEDEAIALANDTIYGLAGYVQSSDVERAKRVASQLRAGRIYINNLAQNVEAPFGGYKQSGNGREYGLFGLEEFLEIKAIIS